MSLALALSVAVGALLGITDDPAHSESPRVVEEDSRLGQDGLVVTVVIEPLQYACDECPPLPVTGVDGQSLLLLGAGATVMLAVGAGIVSVRRRVTPGLSRWSRTGAAPRPPCPDA